MFQAPDPMVGSEARALRAFAQKTLASGAADVVVCGHAHAPTREEYPTGLYLNTGDWMFHRSYVLWDGAEFHLHTARNS
jgi:UDP-2,3-diacylglucosamine pyrophosphatase LpxH